jgi:hypothetical protein
MHYPYHSARVDDPHYRDFEAYRHRTHKTAQCAFAVAVGDTDECDLTRGLELHHAHIEFALQNAVDLARLERFYPGVSDRSRIGAWVESAANLEWLCVYHHRGPGGVHSASVADYEAQRFIRGLISAAGATNER